MLKIICSHLSFHIYYCSVLFSFPYLCCFCKIYENAKFVPCLRQMNVSHVSGQKELHVSRRAHILCSNIFIIKLKFFNFGTVYTLQCRRDTHLKLNWCTVRQFVLQDFCTNNCCHCLFPLGCKICKLNFFKIQEKAVNISQIPGQAKQRIFIPLFYLSPIAKLCI